MRSSPTIPKPVPPALPPQSPTGVTGTSSLFNPYNLPGLFTSGQGLIQGASGQKRSLIGGGL